jgi:PleD family two-component response regulator
MKRVACTSVTDRQSDESRMALSAPPVEGPLEAPACGLSARSTARRAAYSKPTSRAAAPSRRPRTGRILVVNTDTYNRLQLERLLLAHGYTVVSASSFDEAGSLLEAIPVDLLVTSLHLAAFNGLHLAMRSRWSDPRRMVIVTHESDDATVKTQTESLGVRYIVDPIENPEFLACVEQALHGGHYTKLMA